MASIAALRPTYRRMMIKLDPQPVYDQPPYQLAPPVR
jgi:hypothetical protein